MTVTKTTNPTSVDIFSNAKKALTIVVGLGLAGALFSNGDVLADSLGSLAGRLKTAEVGGVKLEFSEAAIDRAVRPDLFAHLNGAAKRTVARDMAALDPRRVVRLLSVGLLEKTCDFPNPTSEMALDYASDVALRERALVTFEDDIVAKADVLDDIRKAKAEGRKWTIGLPRSCYKVILTNHGRDVRTAMTHVFGAMFAPAAATPSTPVKKVHQASR